MLMRQCTSRSCVFTYRAQLRFQDRGAPLIVFSIYLRFCAVRSQMHLYTLAAAISASPPLFLVGGHIAAISAHIATSPPRAFVKRTPHPSPCPRKH
ncbi:hypothetical protein DFH06DRAFT_1342455 [Mycena polygramma]|nr:hypothetical protein DFH06DRAFT_1342455 [Mycena polygramma]